MTKQMRRRFSPEYKEQSARTAFRNDYGLANGVCVTDAYVRVAVGFDYTTTCPVRGVRTVQRQRDTSQWLHQNHMPWRLHEPTAALPWA